MSADPLYTTLATGTLTIVTHLVRSFAVGAKKAGLIGVAEVKDRAALTGELWKRIEKLETDHDNCEQKHDECLEKVSRLYSKIERLEARVAHIEPQ